MFVSPTPDTDAEEESIADEEAQIGRAAPEAPAAAPALGDHQAPGGTQHRAGGEADPFLKTAVAAARATSVTDRSRRKSPSEDHSRSSRPTSARRFLSSFSRSRRRSLVCRRPVLRPPTLILSEVRKGNPAFIRQNSQILSKHNDRYATQSHVPVDCCRSMLQKRERCPGDTDVNVRNSSPPGNLPWKMPRRSERDLCA